MASPVVEGRIDPHKKAHFSLHISDRVASGDASLGSYSSVKYNHKPAQASSTRHTTLTSVSSNQCKLKLQDRDGGKESAVFTFAGQRTAHKKSYILLFNATTQKATLEPLSTTYTFNLSTKNRQDVSSHYSNIYPKKQRDGPQDTVAGHDDLFDEGGGDDENEDPDPDNPYDFRHFLDFGNSRGKEKRGDESEYHITSSPDYRTGTGSASNTPQLAARKSTTLAAPAKLAAQQPPLKTRKRKSLDVDPLVTRKPTTKKAQGQVHPTPAVRLDRRASTHPKPEPTTQPTKPRKTTTKSTAPPSSKIKSAEIVHSSDESDLDADGGVEHLASPPAHHSPEPERRPAPTHHCLPDDDASDEDEGVGGSAGGLEIEVPDERPKRPKALAQLGLGSSIGLGGLGYLKSPSNGPISLASAANSVEGSPNPHTFTPRKNARTNDDGGVIDFGNIGGVRRGDDSDEDEDGGFDEDGDGDFEEVEDRDVEPMDLGPPAQVQSGGVSGRKMSISGMDEDEDDPLYKEMMEGLAGGDSSEESEEE